MGYAKIKKARKVFGTNDFYGIWLFADGEFINSNDYQDHREILSEPFQKVGSGKAISIHKLRNGAMTLRVRNEFIYPEVVRKQLERVCQGALEILVFFYDYRGEFVKEKEITHWDMAEELLEITDPIRYWDIQNYTEEDDE